MPTPRIPTLTQKQVAAFLRPRPRDSHKGQFGTVVVIGGTSGMVGAPLLAARAALKLGAGCVHVGLLADNAPSVDMLQPELMLHSATDLLRPRTLPNPLNETTSHSTRLQKTAAKSLVIPQAGEGANVKTMFNPDVIAIGCGMGHDLAAQKILYQTLKLNIALVLDADALNILALHPDLQAMVAARKAATVLTPHPGEAARLLGTSTAEVQAARPKAAQELAKRLHCAVVLKGAHSLCVTRAGKIYVSKTGNPGMSSPGMGDVLTGMIAAFIAQGLNADDALLLAVHLHGAAGDGLAQQGATIGMTASELTDWARWLLNQWAK